MVCTSESRSTSAATGDLVLRVRGPSRDGQIIRLQSAKCTVGAGPRCTLRLRGARISSLHCLIIRGSATTVVRRWSADTRLNGRRFEDSPLVAGDRLTVGPVELEILESGTPAPSDDATVWQAAEAAAQLEQQLEELAEQRRALELQQRRWEEERAEARRALADQENGKSAASAEAAAQIERQFREFAEQRRALELQQRRWEEERVEAQRVLADQMAELAALRNEVTRQQNDLQNQGVEAQRRLDVESQRLNALAAEVQAQEQALAEDRKECQATQAELAECQKRLDEDRHHWESEQAQLSARAAQQLEQLEKRLAEIDSQRQTLATENSKWEQKRMESERELDARAKRLEADAADLEAQREALAVQTAEVESAVAEPVQTDPAGGEADLAASISTDAPSIPTNAPCKEPATSLADVLRRYGASSLLEEEEPETHAAPQSVAEIAAPRHPESLRSDSGRSERTEKAAKPAGDHEEESIDDYMSRLLARVRGDGQPSPEAPRDAIKAARVVPASQPVAPAVSSQPDTPTPVTCQGAPDMLPRAAVPERLANMSAMREVANLSAQTAISKHTRLQMAITSRFKLVVTIMALGAGAALLAMWGWLNASSTALYAAGASFLIAMLWGAQYAILTCRLILSHFSRRAPHPTISKPPVDESTPRRTE